MNLSGYPLAVPIFQHMINTFIEENQLQGTYFYLDDVVALTKRMTRDFNCFSLVFLKL